MRKEIKRIIPIPLALISLYGCGGSISESTLRGDGQVENDTNPFKILSHSGNEIDSYYSQSNDLLSNEISTISEKNEDPIESNTRSDYSLVKSELIGDITESVLPQDSEGRL